jgi:hypothetical protein
MRMAGVLNFFAIPVQNVFQMVKIKSLLAEGTTFLLKYCTKSTEGEAVGVLARKKA